MNTRPTPGSGLGRPIQTLVDASLELVSKGQALEGRIRFRGAFTDQTEPSMNPPPVGGDLWTVYIATPSAADFGKTFARLQLSATSPRLQLQWQVTVRGA